MNINVEQAKHRLLSLVTADFISSQDNGYVLPIDLDLVTAASVVGALHLALRHPQNNGPSAKAVRQVIDQIIERVEADGYEATAELMRSGDDPAFDEPAQ